MSTYPIRRMHVQRDFHSALMQAVHKPLRVREKVRIPGISRPARSIFGIDMNQMPVHVHHCYGKGNPFLVEPPHQFQIAFLGIFIIAAPPVAQSKPGKHGRLSAQIVKILQAAIKIRPISPEIKILNSLFPRLHPAVLIQRQRSGIIQHGKALSGNQAVSPAHRLRRWYPVSSPCRAGRAARPRNARSSLRRSRIPES